jgi:hypothetical protein
MMVNVGKTKVMIFNGSKSVLTNFHFFFWGEEVEITTTYLQEGLGPLLSSGKIVSKSASRTYCPRWISWTLSFDPQVLYDSLGGATLLESDWAKTKIIIAARGQYPMSLSMQSLWPILSNLKLF